MCQKNENVKNIIVKLGSRSRSGPWLVQATLDPPNVENVAFFKGFLKKYKYVSEEFSYNKCKLTISPLIPILVENMAFFAKSDRRYNRTLKKSLTSSSKV